MKSLALTTNAEILAIAPLKLWLNSFDMLISLFLHNLMFE